SVSSFAQQKVTLQQALTIANENSLVVKNSTLQTQYQQKLKESYLDIPQTAVTGEFGRINSLSNDYKIGISQEISFPTVYNRKKDFLNQQWKEALVNEKITAANLEKEVTEVFYRLLILTQKQQLLQRVDSLFVDFLEKTSNRLKYGEANVMEKASADLQRSQIKNQLKELRTVYDITLLKFQLLLNATEPYQPEGEIISEINSAQLLADNNVDHPELQLLKQQIVSNEAAFKLEKAKFLPNLNVGY